MIICAAGDIHGAMDRMYEDVLAFESALGVRFEWGLHVGDFGVWPAPDRIDKATRKHDGVGDFPAWFAERRTAPRNTVFIKGNQSTRAADPEPVASKLNEPPFAPILPPCGWRASGRGRQLPTRRVTRRAIGCRAPSRSASRRSSSRAGRPKGFTVTFPRDWREFLSSLTSYRVRFLIVGAHALAAHGRPRATLDLDVFVEPTPANARRLGQALASFGFPALGAASAEFARAPRMATLGQPPLRIDVMNHIDGVRFGAAWRGRIEGELGGVRVAFLGRTELVRNKRAAGRPKDLLDVALLREAKR